MASATDHSGLELIFEPIPRKDRPRIVVPQPGQIDWEKVLSEPDPAMRATGRDHESPSAAVPPPIVGPGGMMLDGEVLACPCPDCRAPMSIRLWLMVADCWRCGTSIELTEEQEREAMRLLRQRERAQSAAASGVSTNLAPATGPMPETATPTKPAGDPRARPERPTPEQSPAAKRPAVSSPPRLPERPRRVAASQPVGVRKRIREMAKGGAAQVWMSDMFRDLPAWIISALLHVALLLVFGLLSRESPVEEDGITLSTNVSRLDTEGGAAVRNPTTGEEVHFELPLPKKPASDKEWEFAVAADQDARRLQLDPTAYYEGLPDLDQVRKKLQQFDARGSLYARDPRIRADVVRAEGGTTFTEAAVARGLDWMTRHQHEDGSWSLNAFHRCPQCRGRCANPGNVASKAGGTALALLAYLGAGQTTEAGRFKPQVARGVKWLLDHQVLIDDKNDPNHHRDGELSEPIHYRMYIHAQATMALCELYHMVGDQDLRMRAQRAVDFIVRAQYNDGGWRYEPFQRNIRGDTSVVGWQLMALLSAKMATLDVPHEVFNRTDDFLDTVQKKEDERRRPITPGSRYSYLHNTPATHIMTAEGLLCREYLDWPSTHPALRSGADYLLAEHPPDRGNPEMYYWYYATQMMHHLGGARWTAWNEKMRDVLVFTQATKGHESGSWGPPRARHDVAGGRLYMTALAICTLEVYYRHLPIYRKLEVK